MGDFELMTPVVRESLLGYHPCSIGFLTSSRDPAGGQCQVGSLTGAVAYFSANDVFSLSLVFQHFGIVFQGKFRDLLMDSHHEE